MRTTLGRRRRVGTSYVRAKSGHSPHRQRPAHPGRSVAQAGQGAAQSAPGGRAPGGHAQAGIDPIFPQSPGGDDEIDQPSVMHALHELNRLEAFTYLPPFRGRAIRMIRRDLPFDKLGIDFTALERRKSSELDKLNQMVSFALSGSCRQREILRYFGEKNPARCGHCDNCGREKGTGPICRNGPEGASHKLDLSPFLPSGKSLEAVRMALSGVARTEARFACGKNLIAQMLCGSGE